MSLKLIGGGRSIGKRRTKIGRADRCQHLWRTGRHRRRVLVFALERKRHRPHFSVSSYSRYVIKALPVRSSVVVDDGLAEVETVPKWSTGYFRGSRVNRVYTCANVGGSVQRLISVANSLVNVLYILTASPPSVPSF